MYTALFHKGNNRLFLLNLFTTCFLFMFAQTSTAQSSIKEIFIVDSIPLFTDPEYGDFLSPNDIIGIRTISNKDSLKQLGYQKLDRVSYISTKAYHERSDSLKRIPTKKRMVYKNGAWTLNGMLYSGPFIDYFLNGRKSEEGTLKNGLLNGSRKVYNPGGNLVQDYTYKQGIQNGPAKKYYPDGNLSDDGNFLSGRKDGVWQEYYPNKQLRESMTFKEGMPVGEVKIYWSNGRLEYIAHFQNGVLIPKGDEKKLVDAMRKGSTYVYQHDPDALKYFTKAIEIDSFYVYAYVERGIYKIELLDFDGAIADLSKALELEPYSKFAYANRAIARIRKYQFKDSRKSEIRKEMNLPAKVEKINFPPGERDGIKRDLEMAYFLGSTDEKVVAALRDFSSEAP